MTVNFIKLNSGAKPPFRATEDSAGSDLFACLENVEEEVIESGERRLIPTGLALEIPRGYGGFVFPRSSLSSKYGISLSNCVGVIDADYRGEVSIALINHSDMRYTVKNGERIAQLVLLPVEMPVFIECEQLSETERGSGGFGSTGN
ncbi:MAG: dUTP diphosphatase [Oscillospiraceae bacterium]|nr:dUTP diphosphatase [Oscillospiraceae bacterium]